MKEKFYNGAKWLWKMLIATIAWTFILQVIDDFQYVDWGLCEMLYDGDYDGAMYCVVGTACIEETIRNIAKGIVKFVKEIKG